MKSQKQNMDNKNQDNKNFNTKDSGKAEVIDQDQDQKGNQKGQEFGATKQGGNRQVGAESDSDNVRSMEGGRSGKKEGPEAATAEPRNAGGQSGQQWKQKSEGEQDYESRDDQGQGQQNRRAGSPDAGSSKGAKSA